MNKIQAKKWLKENPVLANTPGNAQRELAMKAAQIDSIEINSVVVVKKAKQFAIVHGLGEFVGEIKVLDFNDRISNIQSKDVTVITPELALAAGDLLEACKKALIHFEHLGLIGTHGVQEDLRSAINKAEGAN